MKRNDEESIISNGMISMRKYDHKGKEDVLQEQEVNSALQFMEHYNWKKHVDRMVSNEPVVHRVKNQKCFSVTVSLVPIRIPSQ